MKHKLQILKQSQCHLYWNLQQQWVIPKLHIGTHSTHTYVCTHAEQISVDQASGSSPSPLTLNLHSPPMSSLLSKQVGSRPSSRQLLMLVRPEEPAPITHTQTYRPSAEGGRHRTTLQKADDRHSSSVSTEPTETQLHHHTDPLSFLCMNCQLKPTTVQLTLPTESHLRKCR